MNLSTQKIEFSNIILDRIKKAYTFKRDKQIAEVLSINPSTLSTWRKNGTVDLQLIVMKFDKLNYNWIFFEEGEPHRGKIPWSKEHQERFSNLLVKVKKNKNMPTDTKLDLIEMLVEEANKAALK